MVLVKIMSASKSALLKMLAKGYKYRDLTVREITHVTTACKDLKPVMDNYVFNDGSTRELMSLSGTVPVNYRGNVYNIPICLWMLDSYPYNPPICFVKPTSSMMIKTGKHVDANGKIYLPYLHEWKHPQSDLLGLIQVMIVVFGEESPVFSRPTSQASYPFPVGSSGYPATSGAAHYAPVTPASTGGPAHDGTIGEDTIRASLVSAVSDKPLWGIKEAMVQAQAELDALKRTGEELKKGHQKLQDLMNKLEQEMGYKYRDLTVREITHVTTAYKDLKPVMDNYVFNDGSTTELMSLSGTVPVSYEGNVYNIPICLWMLDSYPYNPPICFVKPTSSMMIKTGKHVDANGKIYLPYLHEWKHPQSDLFGLIQEMIVVFGEDSPVFSLPTSQASCPAFPAF